MSLHASEVKRRTEAIEAALKDGYTPHKVHGGRGASLTEASRRLGNVKRQSLQSQVEDGTLKPDWSLYVPPEVPDGYVVSGRSTLYDEHGNQKLEWVKTSLDKERQEQMLREMIAGFADKIIRVKPVSGPKKSASDLMAFYPIGDHHMGMLSWHEETGTDYDLAIAERLLIGAVEHLVGVVMPCDTAVMAFLGDLLHYDSFESVTPANRNQLDSDTRYPKMVRSAVRVIRHAVATALDRHRNVKLIFEPGNHDPASTVWLTELFAALYENEPRVTVDTSPRHFHYVSFGKSLIGTHHGHTLKMDKLPLRMATDQPEAWGSSKYRYWWTGHIHHDTTKDIDGCKVESVRVLAPVDAWAAKQYSSMRDMKAVAYHKEFGEVERHTFNPEMLNAV